jgi:hypothetical protein
MKSKAILSFLRISVSVLFYLLSFFTVVYLITSLLNIAGYNIEAVSSKPGFTYEVIGFHTNTREPVSIYSADSVIRYQGLKDHYQLHVKPDSAIGYYSLITTLISMCFGIGILWMFMKIFKEMKFETPFIQTVSRRLRILAALFIISDVLGIINYFVFNSLLRHSITTPEFALKADLGSNIVTGLVIWVIAEIYQRGLAIQDENALTV